MDKVKAIMSIDAESDGLWGQIFSIGAAVYVDGKKITHFEYRSDLEPEHKWVVDNVLPHLEAVPVVGDYEELLRKFASFYNQYIEDYDITVLWYGGHVIESNLFRELRNRELIDYYDGPYVPIEVGTLLLTRGEDISSVERYLEKYNIQKPKGAEWKPNEYREESYIDAVLGPRGKSKWIKKTDEELYPEYINEYKKSYLPNFVAKDERHTRKKVTIKKPYKVVNEEYGIDVLISQVYTQQVYFDNSSMNYTYTAPTFVKEEIEKFKFDIEKINAQFVKEFEDQLIH